MSFDMTFASAVATDWGVEGELLANLLQDQPLAYKDVVQLQHMSHQP